MESLLSTTTQTERSVILPGYELSPVLYSGHTVFFLSQHLPDDAGSTATSQEDS